MRSDWKKKYLVLSEQDLTYYPTFQVSAGYRFSIGYIQLWGQCYIFCKMFHFGVGVACDLSAFGRLMFVCRAWFCTAAF